MTIFLVVNSFPKVSETFLFNLVVGLEQKGIRVKVLATSSIADRSHFLDRINEWSRNISFMPRNIFQWTCFGLSNPILLLKGVRSIRNIPELFINTWLIKQVRTQRPDWVHFAYSGIGIKFLKAIEFLPSQKWMVSCRGSAEIVAPLMYPQRKVDLLKLFNEVSSIHCVSGHMVKTVVEIGAPRKKTFINFPSIDPQRFKRNVDYPEFKADKELIIVSTGRLNFQKGYSYALLAMKILHEKGISFHYHIIGDGNDRAEVTYMINTLNLTKCVTLHGKLGSDKVRSILEKAHLFLLSSLYEGIANAALEALSMEVPVISTRAGGMEEAIQSGVSGVLVDCFSTDAIVDAVTYFLSDPSQLILFGKRGRRNVVINHSIEKQINIFLSNYRLLGHCTS